MTNNTVNKRNNSGFTLIELIVTVAIVAILASIAAPSVRNMIEKSQAGAKANEMVSALLLARSEALKRRNNVTICTSEDQNTCAGNGVTDFSQGFIIFQDCNRNGVVDGAVDCGNGVPQAEAVIKGQLGSDSMNMTKNGINAGRFTYNFTGRVDQPITFTISRANSATPLKQVSVVLTGRVRTVTCSDPGVVCP